MHPSQGLRRVWQLLSTMLLPGACYWCMLCNRSRNP